jgi:hypothetical protein
MRKVETFNKRFFKSFIEAANNDDSTFFESLACLIREAGDCPNRDETFPYCDDCKLAKSDHKIVAAELDKFEFDCSEGTQERSSLRTLETNFARMAIKARVVHDGDEKGRIFLAVET